MQMYHSERAEIRILFCFVLFVESTVLFSSQKNAKLNSEPSFLATVYQLFYTAQDRSKLNCIHVFSLFPLVVRMRI